MTKADMQERTCGKGLAEHSVLTAKLAELIDAVAENLEVHMTALDLRNESSRGEHEAYTKLTKEHRDIARRLHATARHMADYRDLPMGPHDPAIMSSPKVVDAFVTFVKRQRELLSLLGERVRVDEEMPHRQGGKGDR